MLSRLFPKQFDNAYRGHVLGLWILAALALAKLAMGTNVMIQPDFVAVSADSMPVDSYGAAAAPVIAFFAVWGLGQVILALLAALSLIRYRAMAPLMFLMLLIEQLGRKVLLALHPVHTLATGLSVNVVTNAAFLALMLIGLVLSLMNRRP